MIADKLPLNVVTTSRSMSSDEPLIYLKDESREGWAGLVWFEVWVKDPDQPTIRCTVPESDGIPREGQEDVPGWSEDDFVLLEVL